MGAPKKEALNPTLEEPLEFNEGDIGPPGGIQILEPACLGLFKVSFKGDLIIHTL